MNARLFVDCELADVATERPVAEFGYDSVTNLRNIVHSYLYQRGAISQKWTIGYDYCLIEVTYDTGYLASQEYLLMLS